MYQQTKSSFSWISLILGLLIGLAVAGAAYYFFLRDETSGGNPGQETQGLLLSITSPNDNEFLTDSKVMVIGTSGKDSVIAITGGREDIITTTSGGKFSVEVELVEGQNDLAIYAFDTSNGGSSQTQLNLLYLNETVGAKTVLLAQADETTQEEEKIEELRQNLATRSGSKKKGNTLNPATTFGNVKSINGTTLTVENLEGSFKTAFIDDLTKLYLLNNDGKQTLNLAEVKVGDRVAVVGIEADSDNGLAKYLVKLNKNPVRRQAVLGKVKSADGDLLTLINLVQSDRTTNVKFGDETKISISGKASASAGNIKENDVVIATGNLESNGTVNSTSLYVIPGQTAATPSSSPGQ
jgi:hypothetical protein